MNPIRLIRIAAEAEMVRLRATLRRVVNRAIMGVIAAVFLIAAIVFAHIAAWEAIREELGMSPLATTGIVGGVDLFLAIIFGILASRSSPSRVETDAVEVRRKAVQGLGNTFTLAQLALPAMRVAGRVRRRRRA